MSDLQAARRLFHGLKPWSEMRRDFRWEIPEHFNIATACSDDRARVDPERPAIIDVDAQGHRRIWSAGELAEASSRFAGVLQAEGVGRGDRVASLLSQGPAVMICHFAAMKLGAIALPLFTLFGPDALAYRLSDSGAKVLITDAENVGKVTPLRGDLPDLTEVFVTDGDAGRDFWAQIEAAVAITPVETRADDPAVMIYTSGTTGPPKGVLHAHRFLFGHLPSVELTHGLFPQNDDVGWTPADWAWIGGLMDMAVPCLYYGVPLIAHRMRKFDADSAWQLIRDHAITSLFLPPTALRLMSRVEVPMGVDVRSVSSGGERLGSALLEWARSALGVEIAEIYGQTECNLSVAAVRGLMETPDTAMGMAVPGFDLRLIDAEGADVPMGEVGEIAVHKDTPVMFLKYWGQPGKTAEKFCGDWMRTGDLAVNDGAGNLTFHARDDDVITSSGYRIGPSEIEECLCRHPDVLMAAVVGMPDPERTEAVTAFVVAKVTDVNGLGDILKAYVAVNLSPHLAPRTVHFRDELPMTATGKIMRRALRVKGW